MRKGRKAAKYWNFLMIYCSGGSKGRLEKRRVRDQMKDEKLHAIVAKHMCKSKYTKYLSSGPLLEIEMLKKRMPFCRETYLEVKMLKIPQ